MRYLLVVLLLVCAVAAQDKKKADSAGKVTKPAPVKQPTTYLEALDQLCSDPKANCATDTEIATAHESACRASLARQKSLSAAYAQSEATLEERIAEQDARILELENALRTVAADLEASSATNQALLNRASQSPVIIRQIDPALYRTTFHSEPDPIHCSAFTWGSNTSINCR